MAQRLLLLLLCTSMVMGLLQLKKEDIGSQYKIGTITDMFFNVKDKIFFKADREIFGFLNPQDGSLLTVYELQANEKILSYITAGEIVIAKDEKILNSFISFKNQYMKISETEALSKKGNFTKLVDFRRLFTNTFILTDRFLMKVPFLTKPIQGVKDQQEEVILFDLMDPEEMMFSFAHVLDIEGKRPIIYMVTLRKNQLCFREVQDKMKEKEPICVDKIEGKTVDYIASSFQNIYIEYTDCVMVYSKKIKFIERIDEIPLQYFRGFASLASHDSFDPKAVKRLERRVIWEHDMFLLRTVQVEDTNLFIQIIDQKTGDITQIVTIPKGAKEFPRKFWSHTPQRESELFRLYIEFEDGRLVSYEIDSKNKKYTQLWTIVTAELDEEQLEDGEQIEAKSQYNEAQQDIAQIEENEP